MNNFIIIFGFVCFCLISLWLLHKFAPDQAQINDNGKAAIQTMAGSVVLFVLAYALGYFSGVLPHKSFALTPQSILQGILTLLPMLIMLFFIQRAKHPKLLLFKDQQTKIFSEIGFRFTPLRILLMSLGAGLGEELLFRGAIQGALYLFLPIAISILLPSIIFGALHFYNIIYIVLATIIGIYFGIIFFVTNNIAVPIIAHTIYDIFALHQVAVMVSKHKTQMFQSE